MTNNLTGPGAESASAGAEKEPIYIIVSDEKMSVMVSIPRAIYQQNPLSQTEHALDILNQIRQM